MQHRAGESISIFDLDRTVTKGPTYSKFLLQTALKLAPWRIILIPLLLPVFFLYLAGLISRRRMKEAMHFCMLGSALPRAIAERQADRFASTLAHNGILPEARRQIARERMAGRRIILATAAPLLYAAPIGRSLGIADVVATLPTWRKNRLRFRIAGENCYGAAKLQRIQAFFDMHGINRERVHVRFFSDDASDLPTLGWANEAVVVNASAKLVAIARQKGWQILDWRTRGQRNRHQPKVAQA